jgi:hypothetical protein
MDIKCRVLYNSLRINWLLDPDMDVEPWQVENYRTLPLEDIFLRLSLQQIDLKRFTFLALAEAYENPEDLAQHLLTSHDADIKAQHQVYLLVFELWRRLLPEKPTWSIFCDELDYQIEQYDHNEAQSPEAIQDALSNLKVVLDENVDEGADPKEVFETVCAGCASDIESFLSDYIAEQIDEKNFSYAAELLDSFEEYVQDTKWFEFFHLRLSADSDLENAGELLKKVLIESSKSQDLEFNLDLLAFLVQGGDQKVFVHLVKQTMLLIETEEDFQDLVQICIDFYHLLDNEQIEKKILGILRKRPSPSPDKMVSQQDPDFKEILKAMVF